MKKNTIYTLPASTLVETLLVILISGILFIALFDGIDLVRCYNMRLKQKLISGNSLWNGYQRLDDLFQTGDSILPAGENVWNFYRNGEEWVRLEKRDSLLYVACDGQVDTLFRSVSRIRGIAFPERSPLVDSLWVHFVYRGRTVNLAFALVRRKEYENKTAIEKLENEYKVYDYELERE